MPKTAEHLLGEAVTMMGRASSHPKHASRNEQNVAHSQYTAAINQFEDVLSMLEETLGPNHRRVGIALVAYAGAMYSAGKYPEAIALYKRALTIDPYLSSLDIDVISTFRHAFTYIEALRKTDHKREADQMDARVLTAQGTDIRVFPAVFILIYAASFLPVSGLLLPAIIGAILRSWTLFGVGFLCFSLPIQGLTWSIPKYSDKWFKAKIPLIGSVSDLVLYGCMLLIGGAWSVVGWFLASSLETSIGFLRLLLPYLGALLGLLIGGLCAAGSVVLHIDDDFVPESPPLIVAFYSLSFLAMSIMFGLLFRAWLVFFGSLVLSTIVAFIVVFFFRKVYFAAILCGLFFVSICAILAIALRSSLSFTALLGGTVANYSLEIFTLRGLLKNQRVHRRIATLLFGAVWSLIGWFLGDILSPSLHVELLSTFCPYLLALTGFIIGCAGHLRAYVWLYRLLEVQSVGDLPEEMPFLNTVTNGMENSSGVQ